MGTYDSLYTTEAKIPANHYIVQLLCKNRAENLNIILPPQYLKLKEWAGFYHLQLKKCNEYLEKYHEIVIITVIKNKKIWSLLAGWIDYEFKKETKKQLTLTKNILEKIDSKILITQSKGKINKDLSLDKFDG